jgi:ParB family transcriptional regulator, chromosome partitioning protein
MIRLTELPPPVLEMLNVGILTAGQVRPLLTISSVDDQIAQAHLIADGKLSARDAERLAAERKRSRNDTRVTPGSKSNHHTDPNVRALIESIQRTLKRKVQITQGRGRRPGRLELEYYSDDDLTTLAHALVRNPIQ